LGWYLMMPMPPLPQTDGDSESWSKFVAHLVHPPGPFANWQILRSFDSAEQCEASRQKEADPSKLADLERTVSTWEAAKDKEKKGEAPKHEPEKGEEKFMLF